MPEKRKQQQQQQHDKTSRDRKRAKTRDARLIVAQSTGTAFENGEVNVDRFVKAHEYAIKALEDGMRRAHRGVMTRAFQGVPRELRRRTASHNVKRIPKRLRAHAAREMAENDTPTRTARRRKPSGHMRLRLANAKRFQHFVSKVRARRTHKDTQTGAEDTSGDRQDVDVCATRAHETITTRKPRVKACALKNQTAPRARFRKRQLNKQWLPTHLFHAKRAHMTPPLQPLWRFAMPLAPTMKCYRSTHRASVLRGAVAWDTSYMSTIGLYGSEDHVQKLLTSLGVGHWGRTSQRWRDGTRTWEGWLYDAGGWPQKAIAPVMIVWCARQKRTDVGTADVATGGASTTTKDKRHLLIRIHPSAFLELWSVIRRLNPPVTVEDLRWEIGSIEVTGPGATEALRGVLWTVDWELADDSPAGIWKRLAAVTNLGALPPNAALGFEISDPRLHHPPRTVEMNTDSESHARLVDICASWPPDRTQGPPALFTRKKRLDASRALSSQKSINRRKAKAMPNTFPDPLPTDPAIPVLLSASRTPGPGCGRWTLLLPWKCVSPVWSSLMHYPLSTGANVRFGGLDQKRQMAFEAGVPFFPADYPGTKAGREWNVRECERRKAEWERRPKGKRTEWASLPLEEGRKGEVGRGWTCDWDALRDDDDDDDIESSEMASGPAFYQAPFALVLDAVSSRKIDNVPDPDAALATVRVSLVARGAPTDCARIYRLPTTNAELRRQWLSLLADSRTKSDVRKLAERWPRKPAPDAPEYVRQAHLAACLLRGDRTDIQAGRRIYPPVPDKLDLIGFVTAGNYNLGEGRASGVGSVVLKRLVQGMGEEKSPERLCIVRNAGETVGRLAKWEVV